MSTATHEVSALPSTTTTTTTTGSTKTRQPTHKWMVAQVTAIGALVTMHLSTGGWDTEESVALVGLVVQAICTYIAPNADTPGGVPVKP